MGKHFFTPQDVLLGFQYELWNDDRLGRIGVHELAPAKREGESAGTVDLRPAALVTSELVFSCNSLPPSPGLSLHSAMSSSDEHSLLLSLSLQVSTSQTAQGSSSSSTAQSFESFRTQVGIKDSSLSSSHWPWFQGLKSLRWGCETLHHDCHHIFPPLLFLSVFFPLLLLGMTCLTALRSVTEKSCGPHRPRPPCCW